MQSINCIKQTVSEKKIFKDFFFENFPFLGPQHGRIQRGGTGGPDPHGIARLFIFAMLKFSIRPFWDFGPPPTPYPLRKFSGSVHAQQPIKISDQDEGHLKHSALLIKHFSKNKIQISPMRLPIISL